MVSKNCLSPCVASDKKHQVLTLHFVWPELLIVGLLYIANSKAFFGLNIVLCLPRIC